MFSLMTRCWRMLAAAGLLLVQPALAATAAAETAGLHGRLVSAVWLQQQLARPDLLPGAGVRILDASPLQQHRAGHIPGAVSADMMVFGPTGVAPEAVQKRLRAWGIDAGQRIVIVDQGGTYMAPRMFWELAYQGLPVEDLFILDGGMAQWRAAGGAQVKEPMPPPAAGTISLTAPRHELRVQLPAFLAATADPRNHVMLEALDPDYYYGGAGFFNRKGHVPHATLMPAADFFNADKTFKSQAEMQRMLDHLGIRRAQQVHTYCGGGGAAAVPFFALKYLLGYPRVTLFQESQVGWLQDERELPVWTYSAPQLLRETDWLKAWGSPMSRLFNLAQVSVVDVRPPQTYGLGHVPLAVNLPAAVFRSHIRAHLQQPQALSALLAEAGVRAADEAVVVSEGGLNGDAALAFVVLESLGQQKVSIFIDSLERWADLGQDVVRAKSSAAGAASAPDAPATTAATTTATAGSKAAPSRPVAPAPAAAPYATQPRAGLIVSDEAGPRSHFSRVYIASGLLPPATPPAGTVVQLPYARLLKPDGSPRPAREVWAVLEKAGVPRYAEIVLFADDVGDAAINYVILRLMGFADVKVWAR